jgi:hypothetical protein
VEIITVHDFRLASCQATLFTPDAEVSIVKVVQEVLPRWAALFDTEPTIVSAAEGFPREIPRFILENKSQMWRCQIASARIDLFWRKPVADSSDISLEAFFHEAIQRLNEYRESLGVRVGRIAAVLNRYTEHPRPGAFIARHFCQDRWLTGPLAEVENFELHAHKNFMLAERFQVNMWVRSKTGTISSDQANRTIVLVEQDLNTPLEEMEIQDFIKEDIEQFFIAAGPKFNEILQLYYPPGEQL